MGQDAGARQIALTAPNRLSAALPLRTKWGSDGLAELTWASPDSFEGAGVLKKL
jgi:hypothetical protein